MLTHTITICLTQEAQAAALRSGLLPECAAREQTYAIPPEQMLRALTLPGARVGADGALALRYVPRHYNDSAPELTVRPADAAAAIDAVEAWFAEDAARKVADARREVEAALARDHIHDGVHTRFLSALPADDELHARVAHQLAVQHARYAEEQARREERYRVAEAERLAQAAAKAAAHDAAVASLREYALTVPDLTRAAADNYDVSCAVVEHVARQIAGACAGAFVLRAGSTAYDAASWEERAAPSASAFAVRDAVTTFVAAFTVPPGLTIEVLRIMRYDSGVLKDADGYDDPREITRERYTAVVVVLSSVACARDRVVVIRAED